MPNYFRIKEITSPATVLRNGGHVLDIHLGDFIYPDEVATIVCNSPVIYWDDTTGETFTWTPASNTPKAATVVAKTLTAVGPTAVAKVPASKSKP